MIFRPSQIFILVFLLFWSSLFSTAAQATLTLQLFRVSDDYGILSGFGTNGNVYPANDNNHLFTLDGNPFLAPPIGSSNADVFDTSTMTVGMIPIDIAYLAGSSAALGKAGGPVIYFGNASGASPGTNTSFSGSLGMRLPNGVTFAPDGATGNILWGIYGENRAVSIGTWEMVSQSAALGPTTESLARLSDDVYNRNGVGDNGIPNLFALAVINSSPSPIILPPSTTTSGSTLPGFVEVKEGVFEGVEGFKANVYKDTTTGEIVIAVRGTDVGDAPLYNLLADTSFDPNGRANQLLVSYVEQLAALVKVVHEQLPETKITLTGHSLGGAVAQIVGKVGGLAVTSFDAPGPKQALATLPENLSNLTTLATLNIPTPSSDIANYRLSGDQVSFIGNDKQNQTVGQLGRTVSVANPNSDLTLAWGDILRNHSITTLAEQIALYCPVRVTGSPGCTDGYTSENNVIGLIIKSVTVVCQIGIPGVIPPFSSSCGEFLFPVLASISAWLDPAPGNRYIIENSGDSPYIKSIYLPSLSDVFAWRIKYFDQFGWSQEFDLLGNSDFEFLSDVTALDFIPLDALGNPTYNDDYFVYGLKFASDGQVSAFQTTISKVPEPGTLILTAGFALSWFLLSRRRRMHFS